jgi:hypothetical protein
MLSANAVSTRLDLKLEKWDNAVRSCSYRTIPADPAFSRSSKIDFPERRYG